MRCLLDTHAFLWAVFAPNQLSRRARKALEERENVVGVSSVTFWEISLKYALGKLELESVTPDELPGLAAEMDVVVEPLLPEDASTYHHLERSRHRDPFDRMIIWQALRRRLTLVSKDRAMEAYRAFGLDVLW